MKACMEHWNQLRAAIDERGLSHLVSPDGKTAVERLVGELETEAMDAPTLQERARTYDPLMNAWLAIANNALEMGGLYLMGRNAEGAEYCPICEAVANGIHTPEWWITNAADEQKQRAIELGLVIEGPS